MLSGNVISGVTTQKVPALLLVSVNLPPPTSTVQLDPVLIGVQLFELSSKLSWRRMLSCAEIGRTDVPHTMNMSDKINKAAVLKPIKRVLRNKGDMSISIKWRIGL